jgi:hypothetical protein
MQKESLEIANCLIESLDKGINFISYDGLRNAVRDKGIKMYDAVEYCVDMILDIIEKYAQEKGFEIYYPDQIFIYKGRYIHAVAGSITIIVR